MKAMILAAGRGTRMKNVSQNTPKALLLVNNKPLIVRHLENLKKIGIEEVIINLCHHAEKIKALLEDGHQFGIKIHYSNECEPLETGGGIYNALPLLGNDKFILINCDVFTDFPLQTLLRSKQTSLAHLILVDNPEHNAEGDLDLTNNFILDNKKLTYSGISIIDPQLFSSVSESKFSLLSVLKPAIQKNQVTGEYYSGIWIDVGTPERLEHANQVAINSIEKTYSAT
jgi:MurNAc alpha-1-phosphate uridylyltransferase